MRALLFGGSGLIGRAIAATVPDDWELIAPSHSDCDVRDATTVRRLVESQRPAFVFNAAGYARVDAAEEDRVTAAQVNVDGPKAIAAACASIGARLVHFSSDYVFDGTARVPYLEGASTGPLSAYGFSKRDGEAAVLSLLPSALVIRTQWVFGDGDSFTRAMSSRAARGEPSRVVSDQRGRPTFVGDLASISVALAERVDVTGLLHAANEGQATWFELAVAVYRHFGNERLVSAITAAEYGARAGRPAYSVLSLTRLHALGITPRHWRHALADCLASPSPEPGTRNPEP